MIPFRPQHEWGRCKSHSTSLPFPASSYLPLPSLPDPVPLGEQVLFCIETSSAHEALIFCTAGLMRSFLRGLLPSGRAWPEKDSRVHGAKIILIFEDWKLPFGFALWDTRHSQQTNQNHNLLLHCPSDDLMPTFGLSALSMICCKH